jgi:hypothetical protein
LETAHLVETRKPLQKFPARRIFFDFSQEGDAFRFRSDRTLHPITRAVRNFPAAVSV